MSKASDDITPGGRGDLKLVASGHVGSDAAGSGSDKPVNSPAMEPAADVISTPFGLVRMWRAQGQTFLAEVSADGKVLGPAIALGGGHDGASQAVAAVHHFTHPSDSSGFALTVAWVGVSRSDKSGDVLMQSWNLRRAAGGLQLTAANDNPVVVAEGAVEPGLVALPGHDLLLTWVDAGSGAVCAQVRTAAPAPAPQPVVLGHTLLDTAQRRVHVVEVGPLEMAVFWLGSGGRSVEAARLSRTIADDDSPSSWTHGTCDPIALPPNFAGGFTVQLGARADVLNLAYDVTGADGGTTRTSFTLANQPQFREAEHLLDGVDVAPPALAAFGDLGFLWASHDIIHLAPSALQLPSMAAMPVNGPLTTQGDEPLVIDLAARGAADVTVVSVDGTPLADHGPTRVAFGWMQARTDGQLTFTPDIDAAGPVSLELAGVSATGAAWHYHLDVHVESAFGVGEIELRNPVKAIPARAVIAHNAQVAEIGIRGDAPKHGAISLSGADADKFVVIGNGLFLRSGSQIEPGQKKLDVSLNFRDGLVAAALVASLTIAILDDPKAFLGLAFIGRAEASEIREGDIVAQLDIPHVAAAERMSLALLNNAGGRFALSGTNLVVASPQVFDYDGTTTYDVVVRMAQQNGIAMDQKITLHHEDVVGRGSGDGERTTAPGATDDKVVLALHEVHDSAAVAPALGVPTKAEAPSGHAEGPDVGAEANLGLGADDAGQTAAADADKPDGEGVAAGSPFATHPDIGAAPAVKGTSGLPDLGSSAGRGQGEDGLSKLIAREHGGGSGSGSNGSGSNGSGSGSDHENRDGRSADRAASRDDDHGSGHGKDGVAAVRVAAQDDDQRGRATSNSGETEKGHGVLSGDTLLFKPGFGKETIEHARLAGGEAHDVLDLSLYGTTFDALRAAGAFEQVGNDVVVTLNPTDPAHSDKITLKAIDLHAIDPSDFKFS